MADEITKKLYRSRTNKMIFGVCAGIAEYFGNDPTIVRIAFFVAALFGGVGVIAYLVLAVITPENPN